MHTNYYKWVKLAIYMLELSEPAAAKISASPSSPLLLDNPNMDGNCPQEWPEPIVAVQSLLESGTTVIPEKYHKPPSQRPSADPLQEGSDIPTIDIIDIEGFLSGSTKQAISDACKEWGFFQVVNHGVSLDLVERMREVWKEFFRLPMEEKKKLANDPITYQGYGSVLGVEKDDVLDWGDYFYLEVPPQSIRSFDKWPTLPDSIRCFKIIGAASETQKKIALAEAEKNVYGSRILMEQKLMEKDSSRGMSRLRMKCT